MDWYFLLGASIEAARACGKDTTGWAEPPTNWKDVLDEKPELRSRLDEIVRKAVSEHAARSQNTGGNSGMGLESQPDNWQESVELLRLGTSLQKVLLDMPNIDRLRTLRETPGPGRSYSETFDWVKGLFTALQAQDHGSAEAPEAKKTIDDFLNDLRSEFLVDTDKPNNPTVSSIARNNAGIYRRLKEGEDLRLIHLYPAATRETPLECDLVHESFKDDVTYEALSYTWGLSSGQAMSLFVNNAESEVMQITFNLHCALQDLRLRDRRRALWVDAVCIDQSHMEEKGRQIKQMRRVYATATRVLVWLGPSVDAGPRALATMRRLPQIVKEYSTGAQIAPDEVKSLTAISESPWWSRVWCLQEIVVAKEASLFLGNQSVDWREISASFWSVFEQTNLDISASLRDREPPKGIASLLPPNMMEQLSTISQQREQMLPSTFLELLVSHGTLEATDSRDRIYALLGLVDPEDPCHVDASLEPNYTIRLSELLERVALHLFKHYSLDIMAFAGLMGLPEIISQHGRRPRIVMGFCASWVPDWRTVAYGRCGYFAFTNLSNAMDPANRVMERFTRLYTSMSSQTADGGPSVNAGASLPSKPSPEIKDGSQRVHQNFRMMKMSLFSASKGLEAKPYQVFQQNKAGNGAQIVTHIICQGFVVDDFEILSGASEQEDTSTLTKALDFIRMCGDDWCSATPYPIMPTQDYGEALVRSLLVDQEPNEGDANGGYHRLPGALPVPEDATEQDQIGRYAPLLNRDIRSEVLAFGRRLFKTRKGYIGLAPAMAKEGDSIVIVGDATVPFVLKRPQTFNHGTFYSLVGDCYVHGIMDGEAVTRFKESQGMLQDFRID